MTYKANSIRITESAITPNGCNPMSKNRFLHLLMFGYKGTVLCYMRMSF